MVVQEVTFAVFILKIINKDDRLLSNILPIGIQPKRQSIVQLNSADISYERSAEFNSFKH